MRIISDFHDYYDTALGLGIDMTIVYVRKEVEIELPAKSFQKLLDSMPFHQHADYWREKRQAPNDFDANPVVVGFCGKFYPGYEIEFYRVVGGFTRLYAFSMDALKKAIVEAEPDGLRWFCRKRDSYGVWNRPNFSEGNVEAYFERKFPELGHFFQEHKVPVFSFRFRRRLLVGQDLQDVLTLNPRLNVYSFQKVIDPYTAFQEIMMYIPGVLGTGEPCTVDISDRMMAEKKGFDGMSFKTYSPGKKTKRRTLNGKFTVVQEKTKNRPY